MVGQLFEYCERGSDAGLLAEPLNAVTNLAFLLAALAAARAALRLPGPRAMPLLLAAIVGAIGLGSLALHTLATPAARLADVIPIAIFMVVYLGLALRTFLGLAPRAVAASLVIFALACAATQALPCPRALVDVMAGADGRCLNGSLGYAPAFAALAIVGAILLCRRHPAGAPLATAAALLAVSLAMRTIDRAACPLIGHGTHFLWHLLNAAVLWLLLRAALEPHSAALLAPPDTALSTITGVSK